MEDQKISDLRNKWGYIDDFEFILQAHLQKTDMLLIGGPGSGKSTFVEEQTKVESDEIVTVKVSIEIPIYLDKLSRM